MHKAPLRLRTDEAEQISGLTVVVISVAVTVAIGFTGDFQRWFVPTGTVLAGGLRYTPLDYLSRSTPSTRCAATTWPAT